MINSLAIVLVAIAIVGWLAYLMVSSVRSQSREEVAPNLAPPMANEELETSRLERALFWAVILSAFAAISLPMYFLTEFNRQGSFIEAFAEESLERGSALSLDCQSCHGPGFVGAAASALHAQSGVSTNWAAPRLDTIFYRYSREEVKFWIVYGRAGTPMPGWGTDGGGVLNDQQVEDILNYLEESQLPQDEAVAVMAAEASTADGFRQNAEANLAAMVASQETKLVAAQAAPGRLDEAIRINAALKNLIAGLPIDWNNSSASEPPDLPDTDEDGLTDLAEAEIPGLLQFAVNLGLTDYESGIKVISLDAQNPVSNSIESDLELATSQAGLVGAATSTVTVFAESAEAIVDQLELGLAYLMDSAETAYWEVDIEAVADASFGGDMEEATAAVNLFAGNCSRCHTSGYSAGAPFTLPIATGGFGPSLLPPRAHVQFAEVGDLAEFISTGSESGIAYGINGIGRGFMPSFGGLLTEEELDLIAEYLWGSTLGSAAIGGGL
jgi:mono/diheme cytochrome c family protein